MFLPGEDDSSPLSLSVIARITTPQSSVLFHFFFAKGVEVEETEAQRCKLICARPKAAKELLQVSFLVLYSFIDSTSVYSSPLCQELLWKLGTGCAQTSPHCSLGT